MNKSVEKVNPSTRKRKIIPIVLALLIIVIAAAGVGVWVLRDRFAPDTRAGLNEELETAPFKMTVLDVGQGLGVLIEADGEYMLYDGGGRDTSSKYVSYLKNYGVENVKYLVASHYDDDHLSGLIGALHTFNVGTVLCPDYVCETAIYSSFKEATEGREVLHPTTGDGFTLGNAEITVLSPKKGKTYEKENDYSLAIMIKYGSFSAVLTGDAEAEAEKDMISSGLLSKCNIYVAGHHGSASSSSEKFMKKISPKSVIISVGKDNAYSHPADTVLECFEKLDSEVYRTDTMGSITCLSDGESYTVKLKAADMPDGTDAAYVINTRTGKFHKPDCDSVYDMSEHNKLYTNESREALMEQGYSPCGACKP